MKAQFLYLLVSRMVAVLVQAVTTVALARTVSLSTFGEIAVIMSITSVALIVAELGLSTYISKARSQGRQAEVRTALRLNALSTATFLVVGVLVGMLVLESVGWQLALVLVTVSLAIEKNTDVFLSIFYADRDKWTPAISIMGRRVVTLAVFGGLLAVDVNATTAYVTAIIVGPVLGQIQVRWRRPADLRGPGDSVPLRKMLRMSLPYFITNLSVQSRMLDVTIVAAVTSTASAALYSAASRLTNPLMLIPQTVTTVVMPHAARHDLAAAVALARRLNIACIGGGVLLFPIIPFGQLIVTTLLGEAYADAAQPFVAMLLALPFIALASPLGSVLQSQGYERFVAWNGVIFATVVLALIAAGALAWGPVGSAVGLALGFAAKCISLDLKVARIGRTISVPEASVAS